MIVNLHNYSYKVGSQRGITSFEDPEIVKKLNSIIEWDKCVFPPDLSQPPSRKICPIKDSGELRSVYDMIQQARSMKLDNDAIDTLIIPKVLEQYKQVNGKDLLIRRTQDGSWWEAEQDVYPENREYLGTPPSLKPGNCFEFDGNLIAVDKNEKGEERLILYSSDTGPGALVRIVNEIIEVEYSIFIPTDEFFELRITKDEIVPFSQVPMFEGDDTALKDILEHEGADDLLNNPYKIIELDRDKWRYITRTFPTLKEDLINTGLLHLICSPMFEDIELWIDRRGNLAYNILDFDSAEWKEVESVFWNGLWKYLKNKVEAETV